VCDPSDLFTWCSTVATRRSQGDSVAIERQDHPCAQVLLQRADVSLRAATEGSLKTGVCVRQSIDWMHTEHVSPQFNQFGVELIGSAGWVADIEMITMASHFLDAIGLGGVVEVLDKSFFRVIACCTSSRSTRSEIARAGRRTETCSSTTCGRCGASSRQTACKGKKNIVFSLIFFLDDCADSTRVTPSACSIPSRRRIKHSCPRRPPYTTI